jgi:hypothetical protein
LVGFCGDEEVTKLTIRTTIHGIPTISNYSEVVDTIDPANIFAAQPELMHTLLPLLISAMVPKQPIAQFLDERKTLGFPDTIFNKAK